MACYASMSSDKSLVVRGIPADWTGDEVQLFFENEAYCSGGSVKEVELVTGEGTASATVTFEDPLGGYLLLLV